MGRITEEQIKQINELYAKYGIKAKVARELGISAGTVSKYIIAGYIPEANRKIVRFNKDIPDLDERTFVIEDWSILCELSDEERKNLKELQTEISV